MKKIFIAVLAVAATLTACNKAEIQAPVSDASRVVKFTAENLYSFDTKAAMAVDGEVSIFAGNPINVANKHYKITSMDPGTLGKASGETDIEWGIEQIGTDTETPFYAIFKYESDGRSSFAPGTDLPWTIATDGNVEYAMDVLVAYSEAAPGAGKLTEPDAVPFAFSHPFALLEYTVTNNSDDTVKEINVSGIPNDGFLTMSSSLTTRQYKEEEVVKTKALGSEKLFAKDGKYYAVIFPAANISPVVTITLWSGATATYNVATPTTFEAGKKYSATVSYSHAHTETASERQATITFTKTEEWTAGSFAADPGAQNETVGVADNVWPGIRGSNFTVGSTAANWDQSIPMTCIGENLFQAVLTKVDEEGYMEFKVVTGGSTWYGRYGDNYDGSGDWTGWKVYNPGADNIIWGVSPVTVVFNNSDHKFYVH